MMQKIYDKLVLYPPQLRVGALCMVQLAMEETTNALLPSLILSAQIVILINFIRGHYRERHSED